MSHSSDFDDETLRRLLARASQGDLAAFEQFYRSTAHRALRLARQWADEPAVEEFMAALYVKAWSDLAAYDGDLPPPEWLAQLAARLGGAGPPS